MRRGARAITGLRVRLLLALSGLLLTANTDARAGASFEYAIKATFLYKFIPFVAWPASVFPSPASPVTICLYGSDPFGRGLDQAVADQKESERPIVVRRINAIADIDKCQELFIGASGPQEDSDLLRAAGNKPILTVTDSGAPPDAHGIIDFVIDANHVRFDIDDAAAARNNLDISSKLLALAHAVTPKEGAP